MNETIVLNNGVEMPRIGIGGWAQKKESILNAIRVGYRMIDTAAQYGNEEEIGAAIAEAGIKREDLFLTTKLWTQNIREKWTSKALEDSLKKLGMSYIDLYLIHWPATGFEDAWLEMEKLYKAGKIRAIGVSNFEHHHLETLTGNGAVIIPAVNQVESHPYFSNQEIVDMGKDAGIVAEAWCPLGGPGSEEMNDETIRDIAATHHRTPAQIILRWHIERGIVVIPKSSNVERMKQNMDIFDFSLSDEETNMINALERGGRLGAHPDHFDF